MKRVCSRPGSRAIPVASVLDQLVHLGVELTRFALYGRLRSQALGRTLLTLLVALALAICGYSPERGMMPRRAGAAGGGAD